MMAVITIRGARTHNLKNIDLQLPRDRLIVVTGLSGSGKTSLVFDTLYAEGQRRYLESLPAYARQFLSMMEKPEVDHISGLSPSIAIQQKSTSHNPRSTVGTVTEIYDYLRVLFARIGDSYCPTHNIRLMQQSVSQMADALLDLSLGTRFLLLAPLVRDRKGEHTQLFKQLSAQGYLRVRVDGQVYELDQVPVLRRQHQHRIEAVIDRLTLKPDLRPRLTDSLATTLQLSGGLALVLLLNAESEGTQELIFSATLSCPRCDFSLSDLEPRLFSFNNPAGACPRCDGLGYLSDNLDVAAYDKTMPCTLCLGSRLRSEAHYVRIANQSLPDLIRLSICALRDFFEQCPLSNQQRKIASPLLKEIQNRLGFLLDVGLDYLSLARAADTLSGGEAQRIRLASQIGSGLVGVMYVLDEPSIGLHARDNTRLLKTLDHLRDLGNTVIMVEHDAEAICRADYVVDMGPRAGIHGGTIVAQGSPGEILQHPDSLTGHYLSGRCRIEIPKSRNPVDPARVLRIEKASGHNLKSISVDVPLGLITCVTGVSGSGKSTLINDTLYPLAAQKLQGATLSAAPCLGIEGFNLLDKVIAIDQSPIGRTPRSNPATYTGVLGPIRELLAATLQARSRGFSPGRFSFNVKGGRCETCEGGGLIKVALHFLADIYVQCEVCRGRRYNHETLEICYKGQNISQILELTIEEASDFFQSVPILARKLQTLILVGLGYLRLGQSATTLSGGEAQRVKLSRELAKRGTGQTLYLLDEPTTGLHFSDIAQLLKILQHLRDQGNTILIIEHNLEVIKTADWVIDLGPEGGEQGGQLLAFGTPETVTQCQASYTGYYLKKVLT